MAGRRPGRGIVKVNVGTALNVAYTGALRERASPQHPRSTRGAPLEAARAAVADTVARLLGRHRHLNREQSASGSSKTALKNAILKGRFTSAGRERGWRGGPSSSTCTPLRRPYAVQVLLS